MWIVFAFCSAAVLGLYDVFKKKALIDNAVIPVLALNTLFCSLIFAPFIIGSACGVISNMSVWYVPVAGWETHRYIVLKAVIVLLSWICGYVGIKHLPITLVGPINATRPVMTLVGAMLVFNETLNVWQWIGVAFAVLSFCLLSRSGRREGISFVHNKWIVCVVAAALFGTISALYDKFLMTPHECGGLGLNKIAVQGWYNIYQMIMMAAVLLMVWFPRRASGDRFYFSWAIIGISVFLSAADFMYFYALTFPGAMISIVSMVRRGSVLVSFVFGAWMFHEHNLRSKVVDLILVLLGMVCLWIGAT